MPVHICKIVLRASESCNSLREFYGGRKGEWFTWKEEDGMAEWVDSKEIDSNVASALIFSCIFNVSLSLSLSLSLFLYLLIDLAVKIKISWIPCVKYLSSKICYKKNKWINCLRIISASLWIALDFSKQNARHNKIKKCKIFNI